MTRLISRSGKQWVTEIECSRHINWKGEWRRVDQVAAELRQQHPESFRSVQVRCRNGERKQFWAFSKVVRLKRSGSQRLVVVHEQQDLSDPPRFLLTDALHWESKRVMETWQFRSRIGDLSRVRQAGDRVGVGSGTQGVAVTRHFRLSCVAQSLIQRASASGSTSERFEFAKGHPTFGQRCRTIAREVLRALLHLAQRLFAEGRSTDHVLEVLMPA